MCRKGGLTHKTVGGIGPLEIPRPDGSTQQVSVLSAKTFVKYAKEDCQLLAVVWDWNTDPTWPFPGCLKSPKAPKA